MKVYKLSELPGVKAAMKRARPRRKKQPKPTSPTPLVPVGTTYRLEIFGAPRTKKNSLRRVKRRGRTLSIPSAAWERWVATCTVVRLGDLFDQGMVPDQPFNCRAHFWRHANVGDACGFYQGLADLLAKKGVVSDDKWIRQWDGARLLVDASNPRVYLILEAL